jgi:hypothetical protein
MLPGLMTTISEAADAAIGNKIRPRKLVANMNDRARYFAVCMFNPFE